MKRKTAKDILAESFRELAERTSVDKITIKDITDNCGYSPATFYRQFRDKYDLIAWQHTRNVAAIMGRIDGNGYPWKQTLLDGMRGFWDEREYLCNLFLHTSGQDSFVRYMTEINYDALKRHIASVADGKLDENTDLCIRVYVLGTVSLTCEWILGKFDATPEQLAAVFEQALPAPLTPYLL